MVSPIPIQREYPGPGPYGVRWLAPADRPAWEKLFAAYRTAAGTGPNPLITDYVWSLLARAWAHDDVAGTISASLMPTPELEALVCREPAGPAVGFVHFRSFLRSGDAGQGVIVNDLYVEPSLRQQGIGRALVRAVAAVASSRGVGLLRLVVPAKADEAAMLCAGLGARAVGTVFDARVEIGGLADPQAPSGEDDPFRAMRRSR